LQERLLEIGSAFAAEVIKPRYDQGDPVRKTEAAELLETRGGARSRHEARRIVEELEGELWVFEKGPRGAKLLRPL
jgi:hypothetical protein